MQKELIALQPKLKIAQKETSAKLVVVKAEEVKVGAQAAEVQKIVAACDITKAEALELKTSCEAMLAVAIPTLKAAEKVCVGLWCVLCCVVWSFGRLVVCIIIFLFVLLYFCFLVFLFSCFLVCIVLGCSWLFLVLFLDCSCCLIVHGGRWYVCTVA